MDKKIVSFDFDDTLGFPAVQEYAKMLIDRGIEVWIVTTRYDDPQKYLPDFLVTINVIPENLKDEHNRLFNVADELGIPRERIVFTNMEYKYKFFRDKPQFIWHLDDNRVECELLEEHTSVKPILCKGEEWKVKCAKLLFD